MKGIIAVSDDLDNIKDALEEEGYQVIGLDDSLDEADAVIISGMNRNAMGIDDIQTDAPVFDASGRQPEEILWDIEKSLNLRG